MAIDTKALQGMGRPAGLPFRVTKLGHAVLMVSDMARSVDFYTRVLGLNVTEVYEENLMPGGMVFMRFNADHHGIALIGGLDPASESRELHHLAFEVGTIDEVIRARNHLRDCGAQIDFEGRRRAGCQVAVEFRDPDNHRLEIYWGLDQVGSDGHVRPREEWRGARSLEDAVRNAPPGQDTTLADPKLAP